MDYKVKEIYNGSVKVASYFYTSSYTEIRDCENVLTTYHHKDGALTKIERFDKDGALYSTEYFDWEDGNLAGKRLCDGDGNELFARTFEYDEHKNLVHEGGEFSKWYTYNDRHLLVEERDQDGLCTQYEYLDGTDLITLKRADCLEEHFVYDDDLLLVEKRSFDGYRETFERYVRDPQTGMIVEKDDGLHKTYYEYDEWGNVISVTNIIGMLSQTLVKGGSP